MRFFKILITMLAGVLALTWSAPVEQLDQVNPAAESLLSVDSGAEHSNEGARQARQYFGYYGRPYYNYYGGYGGYYRPYYGAYGYAQPYYGYYNSYWRPVYGAYGGFYG